MTLADIKETQDEFRKAVINAKAVGFDGVQIHGANGYIVDQFLRSYTNVRTDAYGGNADRRIKFGLELVDICLEQFPSSQVGVKISPVSQYGDMFDDNPVETYSKFLTELSKKNVGFVEVRESSEYGADKKGSGAKTYFSKTPPEQIELVCKTLRPYFNGLMIANDSMTSERGLEFINNGWADLVSFGRLYISNPDLAQRLINNQEINNGWDYKTFFSPMNPKGYTDYPFYEDWIKQQKPK